MKNVITTLQNNYTSRLAKMYLLNASFGIMCIWKIVDNFINPVTRSKIQVFSSGQPKEILSMIHVSQLPKEYGGEFDSPKEYWPPTFPPQTYREDYAAMHETEEEFKEEAVKKPQVMPSPSVAKFMREACGKQAGRFPEKIYYLRGGKTERRDDLNGIVEAKKKCEPCIDDAEKAKKIAAESSKTVDIYAEADKGVAAEKVNLAGKEEDVAQIKVEIREEVGQKGLPDSNQPGKTESPQQQAVANNNNNPLPVESKESNRAKELKVVTIFKDPHLSQNNTEGINSTAGSGKYELQPHDFAKAKENETTRYKKAQSSKACCACSIV